MKTTNWCGMWTIHLEESAVVDFTTTTQMRLLRVYENRHRDLLSRKSILHHDSSTGVYEQGGFLHQLGSNTPVQ